MKKQTTFIIGIILGSLMVFGGSIALAGNELSAEEVTELFSGKNGRGYQC